MHILILDPNENIDAYYKNVFGSKHKLSFLHNAKEFADEIERVIQFQLQVDLIITEYDGIGRPLIELVQLIRSNTNTYSNQNFKLSSIPILLFTDQNPLNDYASLKVDLVLYKTNKEQNNSLDKHVKQLVKNWRKKIFDDLEVLGVGVDYSFSKANMGYAVQVKSDQTAILSTSFLVKQKPLPYLWLKKDFFELENSIDDLEKLINLYLEYPSEKLERRKWEAQFQEFFKGHPDFIFERNYNRYWSQPTLKIGATRRSYKPDFIMEPAIGAELSKNWELYDLKLPLMEFIQQTQFHPTFTSKFFKCLTQIKDYKQYFMADANRTNIERVLKTHPKFPKMNLIIGKRHALYENQDRLFEQLNVNGMADVYLLGYDEIVERQKNKLEGLIDMRIR